MYNKFLKHIFDKIVALFVLMVLSILMILIAILIKLTSKGPVFFRQVRVGKDLKTFKVWKFRTMTNEKRNVGDKPLIGKVAGVTEIGYYLRRFKIDELPQLFNVLNGEMSLVGPRPSIEEQLSNMTNEEKERYLVRPGLTGLAQVSGNIHLTWTERYLHDLKYVKNISFKNDLRILLRTFLLVFIGEEKYVGKPLNIHVYEND